MRSSILLRPEAEQDLSDARDWYERQRVGLGGQFLLQASAALEQIADRPGMDDVVWNDLRSRRLRRFPYLVYYRVLSDGIEVVAVLHGSRDPAAWQDRG